MRGLLFLLLLISPLQGTKAQKFIGVAMGDLESMELHAGDGPCALGSSTGEGELVLKNGVRPGALAQELSQILVPQLDIKALKRPQTLRIQKLTQFQTAGTAITKATFCGGGGRDFVALGSKSPSFVPVKLTIQNTSAGLVEYAQLDVAASQAVSWLYDLGGFCCFKFSGVRYALGETSSQVGGSPLYAMNENTGVWTLSSSSVGYSSVITNDWEFFQNSDGAFLAQATQASSENGIFEWNSGTNTFFPVTRTPASTGNAIQFLFFSSSSRTYSTLVLANGNIEVWRRDIGGSNADWVSVQTLNSGSAAKSACLIDCAGAKCLLVLGTGASRLYVWTTSSFSLLSTPAALVGSPDFRNAASWNLGSLTLVAVAAHSSPSIFLQWRGSSNPVEALANPMPKLGETISYPSSMIAVGTLSTGGEYALLVNNMTIPSYLMKLFL